MGKGNLEGRGTFDFRLLAQASVQRAEPRLQSSYNAFLTALFKVRTPPVRAGLPKIRYPPAGEVSPKGAENSPTWRVA